MQLTPMQSNHRCLQSRQRHHSSTEMHHRGMPITRCEKEWFSVTTLDALTSAPARMRARAILTCPCSHAIPNIVVLSELALWTFAPSFRSSRTTSSCPFHEALISAVHTLLFAWLIDAPFANSI
ncbi:hypothetical protein V7S43_010623 [Phytophthora oleae]|uniref:Uncharacterized protein n=1 Tax=Phytophthora oleae TaxID=2107226 RepID=A0ABD3FCZ4_9STRA